MNNTISFLAPRKTDAELLAEIQQYAQEKNYLPIIEDSRLFLRAFWEALKEAAEVSLSTSDISRIQTVISAKDDPSVEKNRLKTNLERIRNIFLQAIDNMENECFSYYYSHPRYSLVSRNKDPVYLCDDEVIYFFPSMEILIKGLGGNLTKQTKEKPDDFLKEKAVIETLFTLSPFQISSMPVKRVRQNEINADLCALYKNRTQQTCDVILKATPESSQEIFLHSFVIRIAGGAKMQELLRSSTIISSKMVIYLPMISEDSIHGFVEYLYLGSTQFLKQLPPKESLNMACFFETPSLISVCMSDCVERSKEGNRQVLDTINNDIAELAKQYPNQSTVEALAEALRKVSLKERSIYNIKIELSSDSREEEIDEKLSELYNERNSKTCDLMLKTMQESSKEIFVHQFVLELQCGPLISTMMRSMMLESSKRVICFPDYSQETLEAFVCHLYLGPDGPIENENLNAEELLAIAHYCQVPSLINFATNALSRECTAEDSERIEELAELYKNPHLQKLAAHLTGEPPKKKRKYIQKI